MRVTRESVTAGTLVWTVLAPRPSPTLGDDRPASVERDAAITCTGTRRSRCQGERIDPRANGKHRTNGVLVVVGLASLGEVLDLLQASTSGGETA